MMRSLVMWKTVLRRAGMANLSRRITPFANVLVIVESVLLITTRFFAGVRIVILLVMIDLDLHDVTAFVDFAEAHG